MSLSSGSILADALINTLVAQSASIFDSTAQTGNVSKNDWGRLDTTRSGCVYMIFAPAFSLKEEVFGGTEFCAWTFNVKCCIRDTGNSIETMNKTFQAEPDLRAAIYADYTLGGSAMNARVTRGGGWNGETFLQTPNSATAWIPLDFTVEAETVG